MLICFRAHVGKYSTHGAYPLAFFLGDVGIQVAKIWVTNQVSDFTLKHDEHGDHGFSMDEAMVGAVRW